MIALQSRTAFDAERHGGNLPPSRDRHTVPVRHSVDRRAPGNRMLVYPTAGTRRQSGVFPLEVDLRGAERRLARALRHPRRGRAGRAPTARSPSACRCNVAWVWPLRAEPSYLGGLVPNNPATLADLEPDGRLGRQATQLAAEHRRAADPRPEPGDARGVERVGPKSPTLAAGADAIRRAGLSGHNQVLAGSVRAPRPPVHPARRSRRAWSTPRPASSRGVAALESFFGAHLDPSTALPGPLDQLALRHAPERERPSARARGLRSSTPVEREVHARAPVQGAGGAR